MQVRSYNERSTRCACNLSQPTFNRYKDSEENTSLTSSSTYLYASDPAGLFDENSLFQFVNAPENSETVIPCRPTDPRRVSMRFLRGNSEDITGRLGDFNYEYDPRRGLVITRVAEEFHTGIMVCVAKRYAVFVTALLLLRC